MHVMAKQLKAAVLPCPYVPTRRSPACDVGAVTDEEPVSA